ncbi:glycosyltransferase family 4 protein [Dyadobacter chenwenxiniae]|uniref:Glycosyltransferase family 4 protein n=1 Tax=Dyadobacter chenwenxiniae TaxID=2906456 RepID=A0A9X1PJ91_9BACT|nr:glycosyltransferase family 4 protein [Dyadobacter chenwenxiniae]MCF0060498.1 glycosyltransferase family 4 protein [Dyadobacter chenwenxiniae]UON86230.1 glycosyltransferase family 4 protein [Dyadobacter chenwenxiniae]
MKVLVSHPTGNANVRAIAKGLAEAGNLHSFYTTIATFPDTTLDLLARLPGLSELKRRNFDPEIQARTHTYPWLEMGRMISNKAGFKSLTAHESGVFCIDKVYHSLDRYVASQLPGLQKSGLNVVYAYEDGALETFRQAKKLGITCVYELPIAFWETSRKLLLEEAARLPEWSETLAGGISDSEKKLQRKSMELDLADIIVTPGSFVADSLGTLALEKKLVVSPFGSPENNLSTKKTRRNNRPLRVLFAGSMGQRKGLADLFEAIKILDTDEIELVVLGSLLRELSFYRNKLTRFTYEPTRPHADVLTLMRSCDVFCLPSIVEGRALVIQEAMSQGLPVIITANTGGRDLVIDGGTGFEVPIRSPGAIAEKLRWFLDNTDQLDQMSINAQRHAASYSWAGYTNKIILEIEKYQKNCLANDSSQYVG